MSAALLAYYSNQLDRATKLRARTSDAIEWVKLTKLIEEYERTIHRLDREAQAADEEWKRRVSV